MVRITFSLNAILCAVAFSIPLLRPIAVVSAFQPHLQRNLSPPLSPLPPAIAARYDIWGKAIVRRTLNWFHRPGHVRLVEKIPPDATAASARKTDHGAFVWPQSMVLLMLAAEVQRYPHRAPMLQFFVHSLRGYWRMHKGLGAYADLPAPAPLDRFYDDNEWLAWGYLRAYRATHDKAYLHRARIIFRFIRSGESAQLGGGIFWLEQNRNTKNTCSNGPAIIDALKLYTDTGKTSYLIMAKKLYAWVNKNLQDHRTGLYFDHMNLDGKVQKTLWSYNSASMLIADCQFYRITHRHVFLRRAVALARAARRQWVNPASGAVANPAPFNWVLVDAFFHLYRCSGQKRWLHCDVRIMDYVHQHCMDRRGLYGSQWTHAPDKNTPRRLIDQAAAGQCYFFLGQRR